MEDYLHKPNSGGGDNNEDCFFREGCYQIGREDSEEKDSSHKRKSKKSLLLDELKILNEQLLCETKNYELKTVLKWIREGKGKFADNVKEVRRAVKEGDKDRASQAKLNLPAAMFSGTFSKRSSKELTEHSGILCLDFDHLDNPQKAVDDMRYDPHIIAGFVSPSGTGCKSLSQKILKTIEKLS